MTSSKRTRVLSDYTIPAITFDAAFKLVREQAIRDQSRECILLRLPLDVLLGEALCTTLLTEQDFLVLGSTCRLGHWIDRFQREDRRGSWKIAKDLAHRGNEEEMGLFVWMAQSQPTDKRVLDMMQACVEDSLHTALAALVGACQAVIRRYSGREGKFTRLILEKWDKESFWQLQAQMHGEPRAFFEEDYAVGAPHALIGMALDIFNDHDCKAINVDMVDVILRMSTSGLALVGLELSPHRLCMRDVIDMQNGLSDEIYTPEVAIWLHLLAEKVAEVRDEDQNDGYDMLKNYLKQMKSCIGWGPRALHLMQCASHEELINAFIPREIVEAAACTTPGKYPSMPFTVDWQYKMKILSLVFPECTRPEITQRYAGWPADHQVTFVRWATRFCQSAIR